jgi:hypothetical protein
MSRPAAAGEGAQRPRVRALSDASNRTSWKATVWDRLCQVEADIEQAVDAQGWRLEDQPNSTPIVAFRPDRQAGLVASAQAIVTITFQFIRAAEDCLDSRGGLIARARKRLTGELLMPAYAHLHAAEKQCVLLSSEDQLMAKLPSIRARAAAYLPVTDPRRTALDGLPDITVPAHQALARLQREIVSKAAPAKSGQSPAGAAMAKGAGQSGLARPPRQAGAADQQPHDSATAHPASPGPAESAVSAAQLTGMLGKDQRIAAEVLGAAFAAEDVQQAQVRRFRAVLFGTAASLIILVAILWLVGAVDPALIPLCLHKQGAPAGTLVCPSGGKSASKADIPLVLGRGAIGASLAVARTLAGLRPAGVRYSLSVAQGLLKVPFGAITAVLGILLLQTQADLPAALASQGGLLISAVVFSYAQQLFTGLIDRRADSLMSAAAPTTAPAPSGAPGTDTVSGIH